MKRRLQYVSVGHGTSITFVALLQAVLCMIGQLALCLVHPLALVSGCALCSLQGYPGTTPGPPREQATYGAYGDFIQGYPQAGYLPAAGERRGVEVWMCR